MSDQDNVFPQNAAAPAKFDDLRADGPIDGADLNLDVILDVPVALSLEVGRTRMPIRSLLQLNRGSVIELERGAGEPLDVYVNGTLIAHGEVVVINDRFGVRLTDVVSPSERIRRLR
ncbi:MULTISPECIES: flagellar motor switch protein FliN [Luteimonas]|uniref:Flagellar motor switch protein FliN n=1 Tax=Luteimonas terrae TaxID=1530191 RepID=A0ABU1XWU0_9GAMM|nr:MULTISPECIES: flagellar motor switch protein FliN [Luteimonas]MDR6990852.1 flagellar motor switch protein FliN/FliY [Luteimonas sp. 3794]MDR7192551.1 flagellar motor switch protein FliN/FliY [Luteimonas terrae]